MNSSLRFFLPLVLTLAAPLALAQEVAAEAAPVSAARLLEVQKNHISTGPNSIFSAAAAFEYERAVTSHVALYAGVEGSLLVQGLTAWVGVRYYTRQALDGFFLDAHAMGTMARGYNPYTALGGGAQAGYTWQFANGFVVSAGGGIDALNFHNERAGSTPSCFNGACVLAAAFDGGIWNNSPARTYTSGLRFVPSARFTIGYAF